MRKFLFWCGLFIVGVGLALSNFQGLATKGEFDSLAIDFREDIPATEIQLQVKNLQERFGLQPHLNSAFSQADNLYVVPGNKSTIDLLKHQDPDLFEDVESIEPNYIYRASIAPNDPEYSRQWHLHNINAEQAWDNNRGAGATVAVIDTGVSKVTDLNKTEFVPGYDFVNNRPEADDDNGHGTHVAGTIAQSTNNGYGVAGVAYESKIMPLKVLSSSGGGTITDIAEAIKFAADNGADVINMSLGGGGESSLMKEAIDYAYRKGTVIVAAAGNENQNSASYPARYNHVLGVAAYDAAGEKAEFSNYGAGVDIAAPGGGHGSKIWQETINPDGGGSQIIGLQGTSMAAPHVAGVAALVKAVGIKDPEAVMQVLQSSVRHVTEDPLNHYGSGQLDASAAVIMAGKGQISFNDFFRWLHQNGYLNLRFWFDGGAVALLPKILMVVGSYLFAFLIRNFFPFAWTMSFNSGLVAGSSGLFFLRGLYIFDLPQAPFRALGSSLPELGNSIAGNSLLNPIFASVCIPALLMITLWSNTGGKKFAIGISLGVAACLAVNIFYSPQVWMMGDGMFSRAFLAINALLCFSLAHFAAKSEVQA
jgi:serine protease